MPETGETTETVGTDPLLQEVQALHQDVIACRDLLTLLLALGIAYAIVKFALGWFHNV